MCTSMLGVLPDASAFIRMRVCTGRHVAPLLCVYLRAGHARRGKLSPPPQARPSPLLLPIQTQCPGTPLPSWHSPHPPPPPPARLVQEWTFHLSSRGPSISEAKGHGPKGPQLGGAPPSTFLGGFHRDRAGRAPSSAPPRSLLGSGFISHPPSSVPEPPPLRCPPGPWGPLRTDGPGI